MFINWMLQEIHLKLVYYGPGLSGKTENLQYIYSHIDPALKGDLISLKTREDRTIFFDFLQLEVGQIAGKRPKFNLYTVPGQVNYGLSRKIVLNGVDGIVFVADSQKEMMDANLDTLLDLERHLLMDGKTLEDFPWVLQYNKRDLPNIETIEELNSKLNLFDVPYFPGCAVSGTGIFPALKEVIKQVVGKARIQMAGRQQKRGVMAKKSKTSTEMPVQAAIENAMREYGLDEERWESIALFSSDGLLMAACGESPVYDRESLLEFCFSLLNTVSLLNTDQPLHEISVKGTDQRHLVFRYFQAWDEDMILAAVIPGRKGYRRALNRLLSRIRRLS